MDELNQINDSGAVDANAAADGQVNSQTDSLLSDNAQKQEAKPEAGQEGDKPTAAAPVIPEGPDGYNFEFAPDTHVDKGLLGKYQQWAHDNKLPVEVASKLAKEFEAHIVKQSQAHSKAMAQQHQQWTEQTLADPEISKNTEASLHAVRSGFKEFAEDGLEKLLADYGLNNHPLVVKTFFKIGKALAEPGFVSGSNANREKSAAEVLYG